MIRRASAVAKGGYWCFPGGHVERGETSRRAVQREFREELGVAVEAERRLGSVRLADSGYVLAVWLVRYLGGTLRLAEDEIAEARWLTARGLRTISPSIPSNQRVLQMLGL